jgi:hypothetical protein
MTDLGAEGLIASLKLERRSARMTTTVVGPGPRSIKMKLSEIKRLAKAAMDGCLEVITCDF